MRSYSPPRSTAPVPLLAMTVTDSLRHSITDPVLRDSALIHDSLAPVRPNGAPDTSGFAEQLASYLQYLQLHGLPIEPNDIVSSSIH